MEPVRMQMWLLAPSQLKALTPVAQAALSSQIPRSRMADLCLTAADAEFTTGSISSDDFMTPQLFRMRILALIWHRQTDCAMILRGPAVASAAF
jgi:hypothetical protein